MSDVNSQVVNLSLTVAEVNAVLTMLAKAPFEQVFGLITKVKEQAEGQLQPASEAQEQLNG